MTVVTSLKNTVPAPNASRSTRIALEHAFDEAHDHQQQHHYAFQYDLPFHHYGQSFLPMSLHVSDESSYYGAKSKHYLLLWLAVFLFAGGLLGLAVGAAELFSSYSPPPNTTTPTPLNIGDLLAPPQMP